MEAVLIKIIEALSRPRTGRARVRAREPGLLGRPARDHAAKYCRRMASNLWAVFPIFYTTILIYNVKNS